MKKLNFFPFWSLILIFLILSFSNYQEISAASLLPNPDTVVVPDRNPGHSSGSNGNGSWGQLLDNNNSPTLKNLNIYSVNEPIDSKYAFAPILTSNTEYYIVNPDGKESLLKGSRAPAVRGSGGPVTYRISNVGYYKGQSVDILYTLFAENKRLNGNVNVSNATQHLTLAPVGDDTNFMYTNINASSSTYINNNIMYVKSGTKDPIKGINGTMNHGKLSYRKAVYMDPDVFQGGRVPNSARTASGSQPGTGYSDLYNINSYNKGSLFITANAPGGYEYKYNNFSELYTSPSGNMNVTFYMFAGIAFYNVQTTSASPILLASPDVIGITNDNSDKGNKISWNVIQAFPSQPSDTYLDNYALHFKIPSDLNSNDVSLKIKNSAGTDVTGDFNIEKDNNGNYTATAKSLSALVNKQYTFTFTGSITKDQLANEGFLNNYLDTSSNDPYYIKMNGEAYATYGLKGNNYTTKNDDGSATSSAISKMAINSYKVEPELSGSMTGGPYHVDNKVSFSWIAQNGNSDAKWGGLVFKINIPEGLNVDLSSLKLKFGSEAAYSVPKSNYDYDTSSGLLTVRSNDNSYISTGAETLTYDTVIDNTARGRTVSKTDTSVTGTDMNAFSKPGDVKPTASTNTSSTSLNVESDSFPSSPSFDKDFKNITESSRGDGKNRINDVLNFVLTAQNKGNVKYSKWGPIIFKDVIPKGLDLDKGSLKLQLNNDTTQSPTNVQYDENSDGSITLTVSTDTDLSEGDNLSLNYNATIDPIAGDPSSGLSPLTNKASASGKDINGFANGSYGENITKTDSKKISVEPNILKTNFTNQIKKDDDSDDKFSDSLIAKYGDVVDYKIIFSVKDGSRSFKGGSFAGKIPSSLSLIDNSVNVTYSSDGSSNNYKNIESIPDIEKIDSDQNVTISFKAKITQNTPSEIQYMPHVLEDGGTTMIYANASLIEPQDWLGFEETPSDIDFGTHSSFDLSNISNIKTVGELNFMNYTNDPYYQVSVSYDPSGDSAIKNDDTKLQEADSKGLLFIKQMDTGRWIPINDSGAMLNSAGFSKLGNNSLTEFIGPGKWLMNANRDGLKSGVYSGKITWSAIDGIPNN